MSDAELVKPDFWNGELLATLDAESLFGHEPYAPPSDLYRLTREGAPRLYFAKNPVRTYPSVTSVIHATCPTSPHLIRWIASHGQRQAEAKRDERADYGTCMHSLFSYWLTAGFFDLANMKMWVDAYVKENMIAHDTGYWATDLQQDLVGYAEFCQNYSVRPIGVEVPLASDKLGYAGTLDSVVVMRSANKKSKGADVLAYVDWKSNREHFYDDQEIQCNAYKDLWNDHYPSVPITEVYLLAPKDWDQGSRTKYRLQDCTGSKLAGIFPDLVKIFNVRNPEPKLILELDGKLTFGEDPDKLVTFTKITTVIERLA